MPSSVNLDKYIDRELNSHQRAAVVVLALFDGARLTTSEISVLTCQSYGGARVMMNSLSGTLPLYKDEDRRWCYLR